MSIATDLLDRYLAKKQELDQLTQARGLVIAEATLRTMAYDAAKLEREKEQREASTKITANIQSFNVYKGETAPESYLAQFEDECNLTGISKDEDKRRIFPSLIQGTRAAAAQQVLRATATWQEMIDAFKEYFRVDRNVVIADLKALRCKDRNVEEYTEQFNKLSSRYPMNGADAELMKELYVDALPFKIKERLALDRAYANFTLPEVQNEANRLQKTMNYMFFKSNRDDKSDNQGQQPNESNKEQKGDNKFNKGKGQNHRLNVSNIVALHHRIHRTHLKHAGESAGVDEEPLQIEDRKLMGEITKWVYYLARKTDLTEQEKSLLHMARAATLDHLQRATATGATQTGGRKLSARDLLSDAERILHKTSSGLTLFERLEQDEEFRRDMFDILTEMEAMDIDEEPSKGKKIAKSSKSVFIQPDTFMKDVPIQRKAATDYKTRYTDAELKEFARYYGAHPDSLEGFAYIKNSETQPFLATVTDTAEDYCRDQPVRSNIPVCNVLVANRYKVRAMIDSGSTSTLISSSLLNRMKEVKSQLRPTSLTFSGVENDSSGYHGIVNELSLQLTEDITVQVVAAAVTNDEPFLILGQDIIGGQGAALKKINESADYSCITVVQPETGKMGVINYLKNIEVVGLPKMNTVGGNVHRKVELESAESTLQKLFRR